MLFSGVSKYPKITVSDSKSVFFSITDFVTKVRWIHIEFNFLGSLFNSDLCEQNINKCYLFFLNEKNKFLFAPLHT